METEQNHAALDSAWGSIPQSREGAAALGSFTRTRLERIIALVIGVGCLILGTQAFLTALGPSDESQGCHVVLVVGTFVPLVAMLVACGIGRGTRLFAGIFATVYVVVLALWPLAAMGGHQEATSKPWVFYLINVATVATVLAFRLPLQIVWTALTPLLYGLVRLIEGGFGRDALIGVSLDVSFALILGGIMVTLGWMFRAIGANVDETRLRAVSSYATAATVEAVERERVSVGALMHDSVLAALIAAERAHSPRERTLAVSMAREALTRLANTERDSEMGSIAPVEVARVADDLEAAAHELGAGVRVTRRMPGVPQSIPGVVARALVLAATQAIANALQHVHGKGLQISLVCEQDPLHVTVRVRDEGAGFDVAAVPDDRLGISASIIARVAAVGGRSRVDSGAHGTTVELEWAEAS